MVIGDSMAKKKPEKEPKKGTPGLGDMPMKDLLKSIRDDLAEKAKQAGLAGPDSPVKPPQK
jgi:hypothetical protein